MKKIYFLEDDRADGDTFSDCLGQVSRKYAIERAITEWEHLTSNEQKKSVISLFSMSQKQCNAVLRGEVLYTDFKLVFQIPNKKH